MKAHQVLESALGHLVERGRQYDKGGKQERSMAQAVAIFEAMTGHKIPETDGWLFMLCVKLARSRAGAGFKADTFEDAAAYIALAAESASGAAAGGDCADDWDKHLDEAISPATAVKERIAKDAKATARNIMQHNRLLRAEDDGA